MEHVFECSFCEQHVSYRAMTDLRVHESSKKNILSESFLSNSVHKKRDANYGKYLTFEKENDSKYHLFESIYIQIVNMVTRWS